MSVRSLWATVLGAMMALAILPGVLWGGQITVTWTFATHNMDGTAITDLVGAKVYYGTESGNYPFVIDVPGGEPGETRSYTITGLEPGETYYLNGTAYNTAGLESDLVEEIVRIAESVIENHPPIVDAGPDGTVFARTTVQMQGAVSDDGQPSNGQLTIQWVVVTDAGNAKIDNPDQPNTFVTFQQAGTYVLRLTASDGELTAHDDVTFEVSVPPPRGLRVVE